MLLIGFCWVPFSTMLFTWSFNGIQRDQPLSTVFFRSWIKDTYCYTKTEEDSEYIVYSLSRNLLLTLSLFLTSCMLLSIPHSHKYCYFRWVECAHDCASTYGRHWHHTTCISANNNDFSLALFFFLALGKSLLFLGAHAFSCILSLPICRRELRDTE